MKKSIANVWLLGIILVFILVFACYITITINYTASFKMKNEMLNIIEKHKGLVDKQSNATNEEGRHINAGSFQTINLYLIGNAYNAMGNCPNDGEKWYGVTDIGFGSGKTDGEGKYEVASSNKKYYYCFAKIDLNSKGDSKTKISQYSTIYYKIRLFYKFEIPVLSDFFAVRVDGATDEIYNPNSSSIG